MWHGLLWPAIAPVMAMTAARATPNEPMPAIETALAVRTGRFPHR